MGVAEQAGERQPRRAADGKTAKLEVLGVDDVLLHPPPLIMRKRASPPIAPRSMQRKHRQVRAALLVDRGHYFVHQEPEIPQ